MTTTQGEIELHRQNYSKSRYIAKAGITAAKFIGRDFLPAYQRSRPSNTKVGSVEHYRNYLDQSTHYALELSMHRAITEKLIRESAPESVDHKLSDSRSPEAQLLEAHNNYFYGCFAIDDFLDNSLYRGKLIAYHERYSPNAAVKVYSECRDKFIDRVAPFGVDNISQIEKNIAAINSQLDYEGFYYIDINNEHNPRQMLDRLSRKSKIITGITLETVRIISGRDVKPDIRNGLFVATEGMWLSSDLKEITQNSKFSELISGRINYPMADMLTNLDYKQRTNAQNRIKNLWYTSRAIADRYLPFETKSSLIPFLYSNSETSELLHDIETSWWTGGTVDRMNGLINDRVNKAFDYGITANSQALDLYNFATYYHVNQKRSKLGKGR